MNAVTIPSAAAEINRLHAIAVRLAVDSSNSLRLALSAAWQAGQLLVAEKKRVRQSMGPGAWLVWLEQNFHGSPRTAQRYMCLARSIADAEFVRGLSLRQAYFRLGIATEPRSRSESVAVEPLPEPIRLASRLMQVLRSKKGAAQRNDLRPLYEQLRRLFRTGEQFAANAFHLTMPKRAAMTANPRTPLRSLMAETDEGATAALLVDLCRESPALRHWLWEDFARDAKTRDAFALRLRSRKATTIARIAELTEDMAPWHEEIRTLRARISTRIFGGLTWAEIETLIGQYRAGRVDPVAFLIALQWHRAGNRATRSPRLLRRVADIIDVAMRGGDRRAFSQLAAASQLVATFHAQKKRRASVGYTDWWKLQTLFYILRHPRESYRTRELRAHLTTLGLQVGTKDIRRFCTRHGIRRDMRAGRPRSRT